MLSFLDCFTGIKEAFVAVARKLVESPEFVSTSATKDTGALDTKQHGEAKTQCC